MKKLFMLSLAAMSVSGCSVFEQPENPNYNASIYWATGLEERAIVTKSKRTISVPTNGYNAAVFILKPETANNDCIMYSASNSAFSASICYGNEVTLFSNGSPQNTGMITMDDNSLFVNIAGTREELAALRNSDSVAIEQAKKTAAQQRKAEEINEFALEQQKRRIVAETKAIETKGNKTGETIDAGNKFIENVGKGVKEHGL